MDMCVPTDGNLDTYPHVMFTSDLPWNPSILDKECLIDDLPSLSSDTLLPAYRSHHINNYGEFFAASQIPKPSMLEPLAVQPILGFVPTTRIKHNLDNTTPHTRLDIQFHMWKYFKTRFSAANVNQLLQTFATDTLFSDTPALSDGIYVMVVAL
jgi:hypothetical protein